MKKQLLIIGFVWPEPKSSAAGSRMLQLIQVLQSADYKVAFATACVKSDNAFDLTSIDVDVHHVKLNDASFNTFVSDLNPDVVLFDRFMTEEQFGWRVSEYCPNAIKILDTEDLHFLRRARQQALKDQSNGIDDYLISDSAKREIASIYRCDLSLIISEAEMDLLKNHFKINEDLLWYLPFLVDSVSDEQRLELPSFNERHHFLTIGNFLHEPNYDALLFLKQTLWPLIRKQLPKAQLHNYGAYASQKVAQLHQEKDGFLVKGFATHVHEVMQRSKVLLAPIRFGAGLKGKLFDAMANGTPFVSTTIGLEGVFDNSFAHMNHEFVEAFVDQAINLYKHENYWKENQLSGFEILESRFSKDQFIVAFLGHIEALSNTLKLHRESNFIGQMLQHHSMQSTKFMSKWIESKNSKAD